MDDAATQPDFQTVCDRFSDTVDETQFERFRWTRDEAPKLARLVEMTQAAFADREDYELAEEGGSGAQAGFKRFLIKVHGKRTVAVAVMLKDGQAIFGAEPVERSHYTIDQTAPIATDYGKADETWVRQSLGKIVAQITPVG
ncbi:MAG: hypothetical protein WA908_09560 [Pontixanthobacter sp.]